MDINRLHGRALSTPSAESILQLASTCRPHFDNCEELTELYENKIKCASRLDQNVARPTLLLSHLSSFRSSPEVMNKWISLWLSRGEDFNTDWDFLWISLIGRNLLFSKNIVGLDIKLDVIFTRILTNFENVAFLTSAPSFVEDDQQFINPSGTETVLFAIGIAYFKIFHHSPTLRTLDYCIGAKLS